MARIPEDELRRLKEETDLVALVRAAGVELKAVGEDFRGRCPFHQDDTPSLVVTPASPSKGPGLWHCFGACNTGGSAIDWVMKSCRLSFRHAVEVLRAALPASAAAGAGARVPVMRELPPAVTRDVDDQRLLNQVIDFYHETLKRSPEALAYLEKRGLRSSEMVDRFKLGYANRTLGYRLPNSNTQAGADLRGRLIKLGIMRQSGHENFSGSLVIPTIENGNVREIYGRKILDNLRAGTPKHLYLKGGHQGVWNVEALASSKDVILCEAHIDALTFWCAGPQYRNVITSYGAQGFTADHLAAMVAHGTERVLLAYDRDDAGDKGAEAVAPRLAEAGIDVYRVLFPRDMDANEYARRVHRGAGEDGQVTPVSEALGLLIRSARFVCKGKRRVSPGTAPVEDVAATASAATPSPAAEPTDPRAVAAESEASAPEPPIRDVPPAAPEPTAPATVAPTASPAADELSTTGAVPPPASQGSPSPLSPSAAVPVTAPSELSIRGDDVEMVAGDRTYRVRGLGRNLSPDQLRVSVRIACGDRYHVDTFDLLAARPRSAYIAQAAEELGMPPEVVKKDLGRLLLQLELLQEQRIQKTMAPKPTEVALAEPEKAEALAYLQNPRLVEHIVEDFERIGLVGEPTNALVGYLAAVSRKMDEPLAILIQSNSAAGKSALMDAVLELMPEEDVERYTAMTGQSLYYMADVSLKHRILAIAEVAGAERAGYAIKMLQSEGRISIATTCKDPETGEMKTKKHEVEGPVAILLTTTEAEIDEELQNRAVVLTVNEDRTQTRAIHVAQRRAQTLEGMLARQDRRAVIQRHRNVQRLLRPLLVVNPYADRLTFLDAKLRTRRDHVKYLTLIRALALLHQYQRPIRKLERNGRTVAYLEATAADIALANRLAAEVLGRSLDELAPQTRRLLHLLDGMVRERCAARKLDREDIRFTRREVREHTRWGHSQLAVHLERLVQLEYLAIHRGGRGQSYVYELLYDGSGADGRPVLVGLLDAEGLARGYDGDLPGETGHLPGSFRPHSGPVPGGFRPPENAANGDTEASNPESRGSAPKPHIRENGAEKPAVVVPASPASSSLSR